MNFKRKISVKITNDMYRSIKMIIHRRKEELMKSNPAIEDWDNKRFAKAIEVCSISGVIRDAVNFLIEKEMNKPKEPEE